MHSSYSYSKSSSHQGGLNNLCGQLVVSAWAFVDTKPEDKELVKAYIDRFKSP